MLLQVIKKRNEQHCWQKSTTRDIRRGCRTRKSVKLLIDIKKAACEGEELASCGFVVSADSEPPQWSDYYRLNASSAVAGARAPVVRFSADRPRLGPCHR